MRCERDDALPRQARDKNPQRKNSRKIERLVSRTVSALSLLSNRSSKPVAKARKIAPSTAPFRTFVATCRYGRSKPCRPEENSLLFEWYPYVCPEPVLIKSSFFSTKRGNERRVYTKKAERGRHRSKDLSDATAVEQQQDPAQKDLPAHKR